MELIISLDQVVMATQTERVDQDPHLPDDGSSLSLFSEESRKKEED